MQYFVKKRDSEREREREKRKEKEGNDDYDEDCGGEDDEKKTDLREERNILHTSTLPGAPVKMHNQQQQQQQQ